MKTSEQMTKDVLKRRDEELKALPKKRCIKIAAVGLPCAAAVAVTAVGVHSLVKPYITGDNRGKFIQNAMAFEKSPVNSYGETELGTLQSAKWEIAYEDQINQNPNVGKYVYHLGIIKDLSKIMALEKPAPDIEPTDFIQQTVKQMNSHYGIEFDRFTRLHPDWTETHEPFGYYVHDEYTSLYASRRFLSDQCTLNYVTPGGAEISVTAQKYQKFFDDGMMPVWDHTTDGDEYAGVIGEVPKADPPEYPGLGGVTYGNPPAIKDIGQFPVDISDIAVLTQPAYPDYCSNTGVNSVQNQPDNETHNIYDDDGNIIGAFTKGYNPGNTGAVNVNPDKIDTIVYHSTHGTEWLTYLDMGETWVRICIKGIPGGYEDVKELLEEYTADLADVSGEIANEPENPDKQSTLDEINSVFNPYYGKYSFKFISGESGLLSSINCVEGHPVDSELSKRYTFTELNAEDLSKYYGLDFDRLGRLHPDWNKTIDRPLGIYYCYESFRDGDLIADGLVAASDYNSLNYTTPDGAKILVTAQKKPFYPAGEILEDIQIGTGPFIVLDEDGNKIEELKLFNPRFSVDIPEDAENVEVEIYSDRSEPDTHLVYINMGSWVKIRAEGLSDAEFLELIKEYIK